MDLILRTLSPQANTAMLEAGGRAVPCALGRTGLAMRRREGSGATPMGVWPLRAVLYRPDRLARPVCGLPVAALRPNDGWCDAPDDARYNRPVQLPYAASAETLWRDDGLYDLILIPGINDAPVVRGQGSALFIHIARSGYQPTEGCIALARADLLRLLPRLGPQSRLISA